MADDNHFIVPVKMLIALTVKSEEDVLNDRVTELVEKLQNSESLRTKLYEWSKEITAELGEGSAIIVPSLFLPVTDSKEANIAIDFVKTLQEQMQASDKQKGEEDASSTT